MGIFHLRGTETIKKKQLLTSRKATFIKDVYSTTANRTSLGYGRLDSNK